MCESKLHHVCYSQEKILQRFPFPVKAGKASESINIPKILEWNRKAFQTIFLSEVLSTLIFKQVLKFSYPYGYTWLDLRQINSLAPLHFLPTLSLAFPNLSGSFMLRSHSEPMQNCGLSTLVSSQNKIKFL